MSTLLAPGTAVVDWECEFRSAIAIHPIDPALTIREPQWFVLRFCTGKERFLKRLIGLTRIPCHHLTYLHFRAGKDPTTRAWFPGHFFVEFDLERDYWQQILNMPAVLEVLGKPTPLPQGTMEDLIGRLPRMTSKGAAHPRVAPGLRVRITSGAFDGHEGVVSWSDFKYAKVELLVFGGPVQAKVELANIEVLG